MADLNVNKTENLRLWEDAGQTLVPNAGFESAPSFTAATNVAARWIDGTAGGSTTDDSHYWGIITKNGTVGASFDTTVAHSGSNSLKLSTLAIASLIDVRLAISATVANYNRYYIPVKASTAYKFTYWLKTNYVSGDSANGAFAEIREYSTTSTTATQSTVGTSVKITQDWTQYTLSFTTASTSALITPLFQIIGNSGTSTLVMDAWFDDLVLQSVAPNGTVSIPVNAIVTPGVQDLNGPKIWS